MTSEESGRKPTLTELADALEEEQLKRLLIVKSALFTMGESDPTAPRTSAQQQPGQHMLMGDDPRLKKMPARPTLVDFFKYRFGAAQHVLQSANLARKNGCNEKIITACLLHDIAVAGFIRADHGYWGAQLVEPYVDEEVSWAIRAHQALRFYADESVGYDYPENYKRWFGEGYTPEPYVQQAYAEALNHKWYMTARLITVNDLYSFEPGVVVNVDDFIDIIGRNFKQPEEGLGFDNSPVAHMWRTMIWPTKFL
jgi:hypothetical protein